LGEDIDRFKKLKKPFVVLDNWFYGREVDSVYMDNIDGIVKAVEHIYTKGHRRIGFIKSSFMINNFNERYYGYRIGLERVGLPFNEKLVYYAHSSNKGAYNDMIKQLKGKPSLPSALIVSNDLMAIGVIKALKEFGYHLPKDISLVGFDDMSDSHNIIPPLTSLRINHGMIAKRALEILLAKINSNPRSEGTYHSMITVDLIERESVYDLTNQST
jgi:LacI family transcriptional regulator